MARMYPLSIDFNRPFLGKSSVKPNVVPSISVVSVAGWSGSQAVNICWAIADDLTITLLALVGLLDEVGFLDKLCSRFFVMELLDERVFASAIAATTSVVLTLFQRDDRAITSFELASPYCVLVLVLVFAFAWTLTIS
jgi:hypothetical protein